MQGIIQCHNYYYIQTARNATMSKNCSSFLFCMILISWTNKGFVLTKHMDHGFARFSVSSRLQLICLNQWKLLETFTDEVYRRQLMRLKRAVEEQKQSYF